MPSGCGKELPKLLAVGPFALGVRAWVRARMLWMLDDLPRAQVACSMQRALELAMLLTGAARSCPPVSLSEWVDVRRAYSAFTYSI